MLSILTAALLSLPAAPDAAPAPPPRRTLAALEVRGKEALRFELASPRMEAGEFDKAATTPRIRQALNDNHLRDVGAMLATRSFVVGDRLVERGLYRTGVIVTPRGGLTLTLTSDVRRLRIPFQGTTGGAHVPQLDISFLAGDTIDAFELELRFGDYQGRASMTFESEEIVTSMNNLAWELLSADDASSAQRVEALRLARQANELTGGKVAGILDTLALAQFETGAVAEAIDTQRRALAALGPEDGVTRGEFEAQLSRFRAAGD